MSAGYPSFGPELRAPAGSLGAEAHPTARPPVDTRPAAPPSAGAVSLPGVWKLPVVLATVLALAICGATPAAAHPSGVTITGVDLHDGTIVKDGSTYVLVGTMYGCGYQWAQPSPWCGFGVSTAPSLSGPWSPPTRLFSPQDRSPYGLTWQQICGDSGWGCFNPRLIQRSGWGANDGVWILWFNAPDDYARTRANAYWVMGCNSATGPCGQTAGPPYGTTAKPSLWSCGYSNGDFSIVPDPPRTPMMLCTQPDQTLASERLTVWGSGGVQGTGTRNLGGLTRTEAPGGYRDPGTGRWIFTFNEPNCGYCAGTPTSYAIADTVDGPWRFPANVNPAWGAPPIGRRGISATSCGGQGRTVTVLDGQAWQVIDLWLGERNETRAGLRLEPLTYRGPAPFGQPLSAFTAWSCE